MGLPIIKELNRFDSLSNLTAAHGLSLKTVVLRNDVTESDKKVSYMMQLPIASRIYELKRLRIVDGRPMALEHSYILWDLVKGIEALYDGETSFYRLLRQKYSINMQCTKEQIVITKINDIQKELLQTKLSALPALMSAAIDNQGKIIEYCDSIFLPELYKFQDKMR